MPKFECSICCNARFVSCKPPCGHLICSLCLGDIICTNSLSNKCGLCRANFPTKISAFDQNFHDITDLKSDEHEYAVKGATVEGNLTVLKLLFEVNLQNTVPEETLISLAVEKGHIHILKFFEEKHFNLDGADSNGVSPVWLAAQYGQAEIVKFLATRNVDLHRADNKGATIVWMAAQSGNLEIVKFLADKNVDLNQPMNNGVSPVLIAVQKGHIEIVKFLSESGVDLNRSANNGVVNPILSAVAEGHTKIVKVLINENVDLGNVLQVAEYAGHDEIIRIIKSSTKGQQ